MRTSIGGAALAALVGIGTTGQAAIVINEIMVNPPGGDNGQEFFEIKSDAPNTALTGLSLVVIEGDGAGAGTVDAAIPLGALSTGANGLLLYRDAASVISPAPAAQTNLFVQDFNPDLENGSDTFLLVDGFSGLVGTDLDAADDGTLDSTPWTSVLHAIGLAENDGGINLTYAGQFGGTGFPPNPGYTGTPDVLILSSDGVLVAMDLVGTNPGGPYTVDATGGLTRASSPVLADFGVTPGNFNPVPEPGTMLLAGLSGLFLLRRKDGQRG